MNTANNVNTTFRAILAAVRPPPRCLARPVMLCRSPRLRRVMPRREGLGHVLMRRVGLLQTVEQVLWEEKWTTT